jgi:tRNA (guanine37-N1)-methyltransferase
MTIEILTVLPELLTSPFEHSIMKRAQERGHLHIKLHQLRKWAINKHGQVDDYQYGGGAGMVIMCAPLANAIDELQQEGKFDEIIFVTPDGKTFDQKDANTLSLKNRILIEKEAF